MSSTKNGELQPLIILSNAHVPGQPFINHKGHGPGPSSSLRTIDDLSSEVPTSILDPLSGQDLKKIVFYKMPKYNQNATRTHEKHQSAAPRVSSGSRDSSRNENDLSMEASDDIRSPQQLGDLSHNDDDDLPEGSQMIEAQQRPGHFSRNVEDISMDPTEIIRISQRPRRMRKQLYELEREKNADEQFHIGLNRYIHREKWARMNRESDSIFVKDLADIYWTRDTLQLRCVDLKRVHYDKESRKELTPEKCKVIQDHLRNKLMKKAKNGIVDEDKIEAFWGYMTQKIYDVRRPLKFNRENDQP
ncbi:uncharacterized protein LOC127279573 isoform X3 [Leptopilina boulardi]|uniref:uncharacterized protein LOC127279573 isoform X3 n=1 Tax=Leptopilina boulardi TaxID=63433 RepID=UPI0021F5873A|nr:uncharacterized protein LOC127279573 isoform X3 [Leptopilina boulardi]